jgi:hypothetical protein
VASARAIATVRRADGEWQPRGVGPDRRHQLRVGHRALDGLGDVARGAAEQEAVDGHVQQQLAFAGRAALEIREPLGRAEQLLEQPRVEERRHLATRLEPELELPVPAGHALDRPLDQGEHLSGVPAPRTGRPHQRQRGLGEIDLVQRGVARREHAVERLGEAEPVFSSCQIQQQSRACRGRRGLGDGSRQ